MILAGQRSGLFVLKSASLASCTVVGLLVSWWMFGLSPMERFGAKTSQWKSR